jgi:nitroreductase
MSMQLGLSVDDVLATTRAVRKRLDFDRPVEPEVIKECLELAVQSPTGSNSQMWQWLVVTDPAQRQALGDIYRKGWEMYIQMDQSAANIEVGDDPSRAAQQERVVDSATYLAENFHRVPVMLIPCLPMRLDGLPGMASASMLGSILPGAWSFMLAARERGLGTAWTTIHMMHEAEAAEVLGIDHTQVAQCALITCGYTKGTDFKPAKRPPIETVLHWDTWGGAAPWA